MKKNTIALGISFDNGRGDTDRWLFLRFGSGAGYVRQWWSNLYAGPGDALAPGHNCGHRGLKRCNSAYCRRAWCNAPQWPVLGWLFFRGHTLRIWAGPSYSQGLRDIWRGLRHLRSRRAATPECNRYLYSVVSFR